MIKFLKKVDEIIFGADPRFKTNVVPYTYATKLAGYSLLILNSLFIVLIPDKFILTSAIVTFVIIVLVTIISFKKFGIKNCVLISPSWRDIYGSIIILLLIFNLFFGSIFNFPLALEYKTDSSVLKKIGIFCVFSSYVSGRLSTVLLMTLTVRINKMLKRNA